LACCLATRCFSSTTCSFCPSRSPRTNFSVGFMRAASCFLFCGVFCMHTDHVPRRGVSTRIALVLARGFARHGRLGGGLLSGRRCPSVCPYSVCVCCVRRSGGGVLLRVLTFSNSSGQGRQIQS
jgi:hypothetical protein